MGGLDISDEMEKATTQNKSIMLLARNTHQPTSETDKDVIRESYPDGKQYLAFPETRGSKVFALSRAA